MIVHGSKGLTPSLAIPIRNTHLRISGRISARADLYFTKEAGVAVVDEKCLAEKYCKTPNRLSLG